MRLILFNQMFDEWKLGCRGLTPSRRLVREKFQKPFASESRELHHRQFFFGDQTVTGFVRNMIFCIAVHVVRIPGVSY